MPDLDITLIVPGGAGSQPASYWDRVLPALQAHAGSCRVCANPLELAFMPAAAQELFLIDGETGPDFDASLLAGVLRALRRAFVAIVAPSKAARTMAFSGPYGANLYLGRDMEPERLADSLFAAFARWHEHTGPLSRRSPRLENGAGGRRRALRAIGLPRQEIMSPLYSDWSSGREDGSRAGKLPEAAEPAHPVPVLENRRWVFVRDIWCLISPEGHSIPLTSAECQLMSLIQRAPAYSIPHEMPGQEDWRKPSKTRGSLSTVISRLRRKCKAQGVAFPLYPLYGKGYQFGEELVVRG